jgi:FkbM family methyltransferase
MLTQIDQLYQYLKDPLQDLATKNGMEIKVGAHYLDFINQRRIIRISIRHFVYGQAIVRFFEYYFGAVKPIKFNDYDLIDYSLPKYHDVNGFDLIPIIFPSFAEPVVTTQQYMEFADLKPGDTVFDLGAYSGLTSILFKEAVGNFGSVIALEADEQNIAPAQKNLALYEKVTGRRISLLYGAAWNHCNGLTFSSEGNMGSSALEIVGGNRGNSVSVRSMTLSRIVELSRSSSVDFIKCDIEGAEDVVFEDKEFFSIHKPRIIIETHMVSGKETTEKCINDLAFLGYKCRIINQSGVALPLIECSPPPS